ncbi:hypothetical protein GCM10010221_50760 [Streptomyces parvus]|nr:hypothetical protein GCM10010221_50760 [Streptomyces parvus]
MRGGMRTRVPPTVSAVEPNTHIRTRVTWFSGSVDWRPADSAEGRQRDFSNEALGVSRKTVKQA